MKTEYHQWFSDHLGQEMVLKVYGYYGKPVVVFPAQAGRFYDFENFGMVEAVASQIESGRIKLFCVDSIDGQSWTNWDAHPADRARRHQDYDRYITDEVAPFIRQHCGAGQQNGERQQKCIATGASMGAYHAANFFFRHPDLFDVTIALSGVYRLNMFIGEYMDDNVYFNSPIHYLPNLNDPWYLDQYRASEIIICCGQGAWEDDMLADSREIKQVLDAKAVPNWVDIWGYDVNHDWPWWKKMLPYYLDHLALPPYSP
ncbi:MAG TPA: alpha/beta hydrolase-fold protein [Anaerolineales bacterium]|nr:alpha/beta hydrolase-fold protein [Anaerolineales bacterium]